MSAEPVLLAVAHGSRAAAATAATEALLDRVRGLAAGLAVTVGYVDNATPSVRHALAALPVGTTAVVLPLLLTAAEHSKTDVPAAVQEVRAARPDLRLHYGRPLGPHPLLLAALRDRLAAVAAAPTGDTVVVLAAGGSADPDANAEVARTARLLLESAGYAAVEPAFASTARPGVDEAVARWRRLGADHVVVAPYLLSPGFLADRVRAAGAGAGADAVAGVLGDHPALAQLVLERYREALAGDLRMNCDVCRYRAAYAGPVVVGAPQVPHAHPDDEPV